MDVASTLIDTAVGMLGAKFDCFSLCEGVKLMKGAVAIIQDTFNGGIPEDMGLGFDSGVVSLSDIPIEYNEYFAFHTSFYVFSLHEPPSLAQSYPSRTRRASISQGQRLIALATCSYNYALSLQLACACRLAPERDLWKASRCYQLAYKILCKNCGGNTISSYDWSMLAQTVCLNALHLHMELGDLPATAVWRSRLREAHLMHRQAARDQVVVRFCGVRSLCDEIRLQLCLDIHSISSASAA